MLLYCFRLVTLTQQLLIAGATLGCCRTSEESCISEAQFCSTSLPCLNKFHAIRIKADKTKPNQGPCPEFISDPEQYFLSYIRVFLLRFCFPGKWGLTFAIRLSYSDKDLFLQCNPVGYFNISFCCVLTQVLFTCRPEHFPTWTPLFL